MATSNLKHPKIPHPTHPTTFFISTDPTLLDLAYIHNYLSSHSYWAQHIPLEAVRVAVEASFAVGVYMNISKNQNHDEGGSGVQKNGAGKNEEGEGNMHTVIKQVGFARWITDFSTFGYLSDVFVWPGEVCGLGLGKFLVSTSLELLNTHPFRTPKPNHPPLPPIRRLMLATKDATGLYEKYIGFRELAGIRSGPNSETRFMEKLQLPEGGYRSFMEGQSN
ncbi:hypothetical protein DFH27DRAFT_608151 [Peziza echinospora]|nr:hypothetical protein DFH27DRAFT_608151 [Peziza echinospora]